MLVSTMNGIPGCDSTEVWEKCSGSRSGRNIGSQLSAGFKSLVGGELKGMTKNLVASREEVMQRRVEEAKGKGTDAIIAFRFDTSDMGNNWTAICAYGTAVNTARRG